MLKVRNTEIDSLSKEECLNIYLMLDCYTNFILIVNIMSNVSIQILYSTIKSSMSSVHFAANCFRSRFKRRSISNCIESIV